MENAAFHVSDAARGDNPDPAGGSQHELVHIGAGKALFEAIAHNAVAVEAQETVGRADPDKAVLILKNAGGRQSAKAKVFADVLKYVMRPVGKGKRGRLGGLCLGGKRTEKQNDQGNQEKGGGSPAPHERSDRSRVNSLAWG